MLISSKTLYPVLTVKSNIVQIYLTLNAKSHLLLNPQLLIVLLPKRMLSLPRTILSSRKFWPKTKLSSVVSNVTATTLLNKTFLQLTLVDLADLALHPPVHVKVNLALPLLPIMISTAGVTVVAIIQALNAGLKHQAIKSKQPWITNLVVAHMLVLLYDGVGP